jgi:galactosylceramidase
VLALRASLDAAGFAGTKLIAMDGQFDGNEVSLAHSNASYAAAIHGAGLHYPCSAKHPEVEALGWDFWASEDYSRDPAWENGGTYWGKALSQNYVESNQTATISWSLIWSAYTNLVCNGAGLMRAHTPWSGNYEVSAPIWMSAHWTQFVAPGWRFLTVNGGGSGYIRDPAAGPGARPAGTYVTLAPPSGAADVALIAETLVNDACIPRDYAPVTATFTLAGGFPAAGTVLQAWRTTREAYFVRIDDVPVGADGSFTVQLPIDSITTYSTVTGATHGAFPASPIPAPAPWALPYADDFSSYAEDAMARYFSDQGGSWAVRGGALTMVAERDPGANAWAPNVRLDFASSRFFPSHTGTFFTHTHN